METIQVLIADDHTLFRAGLHALLNLFPDIQVVGEASTGEEAITQAEALQPDVILMDIQMPGVNGIEATRRIIRTSPRIGIIVLTMFEDDSSVFSAMRAGARGYILKEAGEEEVLRAIRAVAQGEAIFGPAIASRLVHFFSQPAIGSDPVFPELTEREREILDLIAARRKQRGNRPTARAQPKYGAQPYLEYLLQIAGRRPGGSHHPGEGRRARALEYGGRENVTQVNGMKKIFDRFIFLVDGVALALCAVVLVDYLLHPLEGDSTLNSVLFRAVTILLLMPLTLLVGFLVIRRVPGNIVGPLLIGWAGTVAFFPSGRGFESL